MSDIQHRNNGSPSKFRLDKRDGKIAGVCGGIANYFNMDPMIVRLIFAVGAIAGFGTFIILYLAIWLLAD